MALDTDSRTRISLPITGCLIAASLCLANARAESQAGAPLVPPRLVATVVDAGTRLPVAGAVVQIAWGMRTNLTESKKRGVRYLRNHTRQVRTNGGGHFDAGNLIPYRLPVGWEPLLGEDPIVRVYAKGYRRLVIKNTVANRNGKLVAVNTVGATQRKWVGEGAAQALLLLPNTEKALATELTSWKKDIEAEIKLSPATDRETAIRSQEKLLFLLDELCNTLSLPLRQDVCYSADSEMGQYLALAKADRLKYLVVEEPDGLVKKYPLEAMPVSNPVGVTNQMAPPFPPGVPLKPDTPTAPSQAPSMPAEKR